MTSADPLRAYAEWVLRPTLPVRPVPVAASYFVCGTHRCGSWFLSGLLDATGVAGRPHQWFGAGTERANRSSWRSDGFDGYLAHVLAAGTTPNGVFGCKLMRGELDLLLERLPGALGQSFPAPRFVWLRRRDVLAQAVSWSKAIQTGRFHHWDAAHDEPSFDRTQIEALAEELRAADDGWQRWFAETDGRPLEVEYEQLAAEPEAVVRRVLAFLGLPLPPDVTVAARTVRSADTVDEDWLRRLRAPP
jgi:LPS sulfotransferase NodH